MMHDKRVSMCFSPYSIRVGTIAVPLARYQRPWLAVSYAPVYAPIFRRQHPQYSVSALGITPRDWIRPTNSSISHPSSAACGRRPTHEGAVATSPTETYLGAVPRAGGSPVQRSSDSDDG